jgi:hypothetical protein
MALINKQDEQKIKELNHITAKCIVCNTNMPDYEPEYCCNGRDCACRGLPIEPPICSTECWDVVT